MILIIPKILRGLNVLELKTSDQEGKEFQARKDDSDSTHEYLLYARNLEPTPYGFRQVSLLSGPQLFN